MGGKRAFKPQRRYNSSGKGGQRGWEPRSWPFWKYFTIYGGNKRKMPWLF